MMLFDWFVVPFTLGLVFLVGILLVKYTGWIAKLPVEELKKVKKGIFSVKTLGAIREVFMESLLHRKIFKVNPLLGYMHASLAFGWFLLIVIGNFESRIFYDGHMSPPYVSIFFRFFNPHPVGFRYEGAFSFLMDITLLIVLSGVAFAWFKRIYSRFFGMKKTTVLKPGDRFALGALWLIFPFRFLAESLTSASFGGGHFLTAGAGSLFAGFLPVQSLVYPAWLAYSSALGVFFVSLPFSRYMHIPTEVLVIFLRKYGVTEQKEMTTYSEAEINSCSRCGVCIDTCQLAMAMPAKKVQSVYYLQDLRNNEMCAERSMNCLLCGRCDSICPVGIDISSLRMAGRRENDNHKANVFSYIPREDVPQADVIYFAGCMTHLQPSVKKSMKEILKASGEHFWFMDEAGSVCCGRPMMLAGKVSQARELMAKNKAMIEASGARILVTSCPICYKVFREEYQLSVQVLHHSQYLLNLIETKKIHIYKQQINAVYHDPCELGRGSGIYEQPRELVRNMMNLKSSGYEKADALCCGGSLANLTISPDDRKQVTANAVKMLTRNEPDVLLTGCPMCKKTFARAASVPVYDIAEMVSKSLVREDYYLKKKMKTKRMVPQEVENEG
jgi:Fe-S oxidoreductase